MMRACSVTPRNFLKVTFAKSCGATPVASRNWRLVLRLGFRSMFILRELPGILNEVLLRLETGGED
jgi:hypothetical protein